MNMTCIRLVRFNCVLTKNTDLKTFIKSVGYLSEKIFQRNNSLKIKINSAKKVKDTDLVKFAKADAV